jgi:hypothetical protein
MADPPDHSRKPEKPAPRFNPFANEEDMFKIVLWVGGICLVLLPVIVGIKALV